MDQQYPTVAKIPILDTGKFEQWQFRIQQYLQHEHYALWEVIEFRDSYEVPINTTDTTTTTTTSGETGTKSGRTVTLNAEDMQKKKNDVKARTTLLICLPDEHQLQFKVEQDDLNQKFLTSLAPEWLMHTIVWRNRSDHDTMSLAKHSSGNEDGNTACVLTASTNVPTASASVATISQDTACAYITSQSSGFQIKFEDINQIDEDDIEEMDIKWNMALLSMWADKFWKRTGKKISIQGSDVAGFDKSKVECFNCYKTGHFARECRALRSQDRGRRDNFRQGSKAEEQAPKALMAIDGVGWDWSYMANDGEDHALVADEEAPTEFALMANTSTESKRSDKNKEGLGYTAVPPPPVQLYISPKKDLSWTGLPECADDTVTDYSRPSTTVEITSEENQNRNPSVSENVASPSTPKPFIKFVKAKDSQSESPEFVMKKKACFNCGDFNHLAYDCRKRVKKNFTPRPVAHRPYRPSQRPVKTNMNGARPNRTFFNKQAHSYANRPIHRTSVVRSPYRAPWVPSVNRNYPPINKKFSTGSRNFLIANRKFSTVSRKFPTGCTKSPTVDIGMKGKAIKPSACWSWKPSHNLSNKGPKNNSGSSQNKIDDKRYCDSGCSRHMTCNISYLSDYEPFDGGYVSFGQGGCKIIGKGIIKTVLGRDFKLLNDANILLRTLRQHNMYSIDLNNIVPLRDLTCLVAKASADEWKQHKAFCKSKLVNSVTKPLHTLHMDLFGTTSAHSYANRPFHRTSAMRSPHRAPWVPTVNRNFPPVNRKFFPGSRNFPTANRKFPTASRKLPTGSTNYSTADMGMKGKAGISQNNIDDKGYWDSGCSRNMTGNISYLSDFEPFDGGYVSFGQGGCKITHGQTRT
nr:hypothetical protein [Tanacetum cinerariifolium]